FEKGQSANKCFPPSSTPQRGHRPGHDGRASRPALAASAHEAPARRGCRDTWFPENSGEPVRDLATGLFPTSCMCPAKTYQFSSERPPFSDDVGTRFQMLLLRTVTPFLELPNIVFAVQPGRSHQH